MMNNENVRNRRVLQTEASADIEADNCTNADYQRLSQGSGFCRLNFDRGCLYLS